MADKTPPKPAAAPEKKEAPLSREAETNARITLLQAQKEKMEKELRMSQGKLANRNPALVKEAKKENTELLKRLSSLQKVLYALIEESFNPALAEDAKLKTEILREAAISFCKKANIDQEIWKNIVS